nr:hypothetical protein [Tanacetum cinerariifolium]
MRIDELYKFSDGTLNDVRNALNDRLKGIRMQYLLSTIWKKWDKDRAAAMIQAIKKMLKTRRIMRSLEKFVGGRLNKSENTGIVPTEMELILEQTQQGISHEVSDIRDQLNAEAEAVQIIITGIDNDIYSTVDACSNACEMWKAIERLKQEPPMVDEDDETSKDKEIDKLMALISLSFKKIYKPTNNNLRTLSNTSRVNQDNSLRFNKNAGYENQRNGIVVGARETVSNDDHYNVFAMESTHPEQSESVLDTYPIGQDAQNVIIDSLDMSDDREEIDQNDDDNGLAKEQAQIKLYKTREDKELKKVIEFENKVKVLDNIVYKIGQSVQTMNMLNNKCRTSFAKPEILKKAKRANPRLYDIGYYNDNIALMVAPESDEVIRLEKESRSKLSDLIRPYDYTKLNNLYDLFVPQREKSINAGLDLFLKCLNEEMVVDLRYFNSLELEVDSLTSQLETQRTQINAGLDLFLKCLNEEMVVDLRYFNSLELEVDSLTSQ